MFQLFVVEKRENFGHVCPLCKGKKLRVVSWFSWKGRRTLGLNNLRSQLLTFCDGDLRGISEIDIKNLA